MYINITFNRLRAWI